VCRYSLPSGYRPVKRMARRGVLAGLLGLVALAGYVWAGLPARSEVRRLVRETPTETSLMRQRDREAESTGRKVRREKAWVPLSQMSRNLIHAVITAEDARFFGHEGVDWVAIRESAERNLERGRFARGGSTITQQLAKNLYFTSDKSLIRKLRELIVARWLEADLRKARILELYLNLIEWGDGLYGCETAARRYYGRSAASLDEATAAGLAAMIPNPRRLNPLVNPRRHARAQQRILWLMAQAGYARSAVAGLGAEPPPVEVDEAEPDETPLAVAPANEAPVTTLAAPEATPSPSPESPPTPR
jgi:monofunctional glycosyltransferase